MLCAPSSVATHHLKTREVKQLFENNNKDKTSGVVIHSRYRIYYI